MSLQLLRQRRDMMYRLANGAIVDDVCPVCNNPASVVGELIKRYLGHTSDEPEYICTKCRDDIAKAKKKKRIALRHMKTVHTKKITPGRNDLCDCESGRKFKRCCGKAS